MPPVTLAVKFCAAKLPVAVSPETSIDKSGGFSAAGLMKAQLKPIFYPTPADPDQLVPLSVFKVVGEILVKPATISIVSEPET